MDDLDIQTAQLIIQLARDDIYQHDNGFRGNNQDGRLLSDLEFALAEQEREFMQYWAEYGHTQTNQSAGGPGPQAGGSGGGNVGNSGGANQTVGNGAFGLPRTATPINLIDDDDDEDIYENPYEPTSAASISNNHHNRIISPQPRAATPILLIPVDDDDDDDVQSGPLAAASSSNSDRNPISNDDSHRSNNPFLHTDDPNITFVTSMLSGWTAPDSQLTRATTSTAGSSLPDDEVVEIPRPSSPTLEQLLSQVFALANDPESQAASSSTAVNRLQAHPGSQVRQAGPSNLVPESTAAISTSIRPVTPDDDYAVEVIDEYQAPRPIEVDISQQRAAVSRQVVRVAMYSNDEEPSDDESSIYSQGIYSLAERNVECYFCKDVCPISTTINTSCDHRLCRGCISRLVGICIKDETAYPPQCCGNKLQTTELRILDHKLRQQFTAKTREYETPIPVRVYCHRCGEFLDSNSSTISTGSSSTSAASIHTSRYCDVCFVRTCVSCKQASHPSRECQETQDEKALKGLAKQKGWQTCPLCKAVVELSAGCYHVMCRCSAQFCYLCATRWKECNCPAFDEERLLAMAA